MPSAPPSWGSQGKLASGAGYMLRHLTVNPGATLPVESGAEFRRMMVVASGSGTLRIGTRQREISARRDLRGRPRTGRPGHQ